MNCIVVGRINNITIYTLLIERGIKEFSFSKSKRDQDNNANASYQN